MAPTVGKPFTVRVAAPETEYSETFIQGMVNRMSVSYYKYGPVAEAVPDNVDALASLRLRLERYEQTGNTEWLMDAANYAMMEFMHPRHPGAHYRPTDSAESPGSVTVAGETVRDYRNSDLHELLQSPSGG